MKEHIIGASSGKGACTERLTRELEMMEKGGRVIGSSSSIVRDWSVEDEEAKRASISAGQYCIDLRVRLWRWNEGRTLERGRSLNGASTTRVFRP